MKYANLRVLRILLIAFSIIVPVSIVVVAGNRITKTRAEQARTKAAKAKDEQKRAILADRKRAMMAALMAAREQDMEYATNAEISRRDMEGDFVVAPATGFPQVCTPAVSSLSAEFWENTPFADDVFANLAWTCGAGTDSTGCQMVVVVVLYRDGDPYPSTNNNVFHRDTVKINCSGSDSRENSVQLGAVSLPDGYYEASILVYPGNWAHLVNFPPLPPIAAHTQIGWTVD